VRLKRASARLRQLESEIVPATVEVGGGARSERHRLVEQAAVDDGGVGGSGGKHAGASGEGVGDELAVESGGRHGYLVSG